MSRPSSPPPLAECLSGEELLQWRRNLLRHWGGESAAFDWLLAAAAGLSPSRLHSVRLQPGDPVELTRSRGELEHIWRQHTQDACPLQYLLGRCYWRDVELEVNPHVLIPRPETELMVDLAHELLESTASQPAQGLLWADLGTGSGCLAVGLAQALPNSRGLAVDISAAALWQAALNFERLGCLHRVQCLRGHWFAPLKPWWGQLDLVVANPPYIPSACVDQLDPVVRDHEPRLALDGGSDGLEAMRAIMATAAAALAPGGWLLVEHHHDQSQAILPLLAAHGLVDCQSHPDLDGHWRFASARRSTLPPLPALEE